MTPPEPITVSFMNELKDHLQAQRLLYRESLLWKADKVVAILLLGFGIWSVWGAGWLWWTAIWFPLAVMEWFNVLSLDKLRTRIWFRQNPKFREEYRLSFTPDNLHFNTESIDSTVQWSHYDRVIESSTLFLLIYGKRLYTLVPKRSFLEDMQMEAFRALLREKIPRYYQR